MWRTCITSPKEPEKTPKVVNIPQPVVLRQDYTTFFFLNVHQRPFLEALPGKAKFLLKEIFEKN